MTKKAKSAYIPIEKIREMSDDELVKLSQDRSTTNGCFTQNAESAMRVRRERSGSAQWHGIGRKAPSFQAMHQAETGYSGFYKKFK